MISADDNDHLALWAEQTTNVLLGPFMLWHKWSRGTTYDNISSLGRPIMLNINGPLGPFKFNMPGTLNFMF